MPHYLDDSGYPVVVTRPSPNLWTFYASQNSISITIVQYQHSYQSFEFSYYKYGKTEVTCLTVMNVLPSKLRIPHCNQLVMSKKAPPLNTAETPSGNEAP